LATVRYVLSLVAMYFCRLCAKKNCLPHPPADANEGGCIQTVLLPRRIEAEAS
jgi:hypothetical protein